MMNLVWNLCKDVVHVADTDGFSLCEQLEIEDGRHVQFCGDPEHYSDKHLLCYHCSDKLRKTEEAQRRVQWHGNWYFKRICGSGGIMYHYTNDKIISLCEGIMFSDFVVKRTFVVVGSIPTIHTVCDKCRRVNGEDAAEPATRYSRIEIDKVRLAMWNGG